MTDEERTTLQLAAATYRHPAVRESHALEMLGLTPTLFWARVHGLIERPDVLAEMPVEARRLQRLRDSRRRHRASRRPYRA